MADQQIKNVPDSPTPTPPQSGAERFVGHANLMSKLTFLSRISGLARDKACSYFLGVGTTWSAFWIGFQFPNLFRRIFGEGALTAIFLPVYTRVLAESGPQAAQALARRVFAILALVLLIIVAAAEAVAIPIALSHAVLANNRLAAGMVAIMLPYCIAICLVALLGAMAAAHERFAAQSLMPMVANGAMILAAAVPVAIWTRHYPLDRRIVWVAGAVLASGLVQLAIMLLNVGRAGIHLTGILKTTHAGHAEIAGPAVRLITRRMLPMVLGLSAVQLNTFLDSQIAWWFSPDGHGGLSHFHLLGRLIATPMLAGALGKLSVAQRIYLLPVGIFGVATATAVFPQLSRAAVAGDMPEIKRLTRAAIAKSLFLSLPAAIGMIIICPMLISAIYLGGRVNAADVARAVWAARWYCAGIWAFELQMILVRVFYAMDDAQTPMKTAAAMVLLNITLNLILIWPMREGGIAASTSISAAIQCLVLLWLLRRRIGLLGLKRLSGHIFKTLVVTAAMGAAALLVNFAVGRITQLGPVYSLPAVAVRLPLVLLTAVLVFAAAARILNMEELRQAPVIGRFARRSTGARRGERDRRPT